MINCIEYGGIHVTHMEENNLWLLDLRLLMNIDLKRYLDLNISLEFLIFRFQSGDS